MTKKMKMTPKKCTSFNVSDGKYRATHTIYKGVEACDCGAAKIGVYH